MGYGSFVRLGYGAAFPLTDEEDERLWSKVVGPFESRYGVQLVASYEAKPRCLCIPLGVSDGGISVDKEVVMSPIDCAMVLHAVLDLDNPKERLFVKALEGPPEHLKIIDHRVLNWVVAVWGKFRAAAATEGFSVPEGKFLVIADYD